jgi:predicted  nucleic acid-binding Zn-ribbon protein
MSADTSSTKQRSVMMSIPQLFFGVAALLVVGASAAHNEGNPIQRVVNMIQALQLKVEQTGKEEEKLFDEYMCYCKESGNNLQKSIGDAETKIPQVESSLKELRSEKDQLTSDVAQHQKDLDDAQQSLAEATATRNKEADTYSQQSADMSANIAAMGKAITALEKGAAGSFLQTASAAVLRHLITDAGLTDTDHEMLSSFLQGGNAMGQDSDGFAPRSGEITGILKQLKETTENDLKQATEDEDKAKKEYDSLSAAKNQEIDALKQVIQQKTARLGEVSSEIAQSEEDLDDTKTSLAEDKKFFAELEVNCESKKSEWEVRSKTRSEELLAIADTLKILNDGSALNLFKSTLPIPSLLQERAVKNDMRERAFAFLQQGARRGSGMGDRRLGLLAMTLHGRHAQFDKVIEMVDGMVTLLGKEQAEDDEKFAYCTKEMDTAEAKKAAFESSISDLEKLIDSGKQSIVTLVEEISNLAKGVKELDNEVSEATKMRQEENSAFIDEMSSNSAAKDLLFIAKNRLSKFYKKAALIQVKAHHHVAPPAPPAGFGGGSGSNKEESGGVLAMIDELSADLTKEIEEAKSGEAKAQALYEEFIGESKKKRATDSELITEKEGHKAGAEEALNANQKDKKSKGAEKFANDQYITSLHKECDFILENYKLRERARVGEIASLKNAKAVLTSAGGAAFLQLDMSVHNTHLRGSA